MDFIIGGRHQGKRDYVRNHYRCERVFDGSFDDLEQISSADVILNFHKLIKRLLQLGMEQDEITQFFQQLSPQVIVAEEIGYGLVPMEPFERKYREETGRQCCHIATRADNVVRIICGIPTVIKEAGIEILFIRHGFTKGNEEGRYVGTTDESLTEKGKEALRIVAKELSEFRPDIVWVSPMKRCLETAEILFPEKQVKTVDGFQECNFGAFEYKNYHELNGNEDYQKFIDSGGMIGFPGGELPEVFRARCRDAFLRELHQLDTINGAGISKIALVAHGGTIMSILDAFSDPHKDYFSWQAKNGAGFYGKLMLKKKNISDLKVLFDGIRTKEN